VHYKHRNPWLTDTFALTPEQVTLFQSEKTSDDVQMESDAQTIEVTKWFKIKALPWVTVDGCLDKDTLKMWLSHVFSYCIENPKTPFMALCDKFCFLKPVDVFYLTEMLEEIGALEIRRTSVKADLLSDFQQIDDYKATMLDKFEEMFIEPNNVCFTMLGSFFHAL